MFSTIDIFLQNFGWISSLFQVLKFLERLVKWKRDILDGPLSKVYMGIQDLAYGDAQVLECTMCIVIPVLKGGLKSFN